MIKNFKAQPNLPVFILAIITVAWMSGILLNSWLHVPSLILIIGAALSLIGVILLWRNNQGLLISLVMLWLLLGAWRFASVSPIGDPQAINAFIGPDKVVVRGLVADEPKLHELSHSLLVDVNSISFNSGSSWENAHGQIEVQLTGATIDDPYGPHYGDIVELPGKLQPPLPHQSPEILASMAFAPPSIVGSGGNPIIATLYHLRISLATIITQSLPQPMAALLIAILLSLRTPALMPLVTTFNQTGLAHLIAPSGFKVTILAGLVARSTRWLHSKRGKQDELSKSLLPAQRRKGNRLRWIATAPVILSILGYTFLSGGGPAALRAGIMGILLIVAPRMGRIYNIYTALALMALLMSISDPFVLWDTGFQLSMLGTLGIVSITPLLLRLFRPIERFPVAHHTVEIIVVTLAAEIATLPIFALSFNQVSLIAPVTNMLTVPLLGPILLLGMLVCGAGIISIHLGILCGWITWPLLWYVIHVVSWCAAIPGAFFSANNLDTRLPWGYYALLILVLTRALPGRSVQSQTSHLDATTPALLRRSWPVLQYAAVLIVVMATGATVAAAPPDRQLTITLLNVGPAGKPPQGEAILIHTPDDKTMLIDGGLDATSLAQELDSRLPFWQRTIDTVILTAPRQDHLNGLQDVVSRFQVNQVLDAGMLHPNAGYALWRHTISERSLLYSQVREGTSVALGAQVTLEVLWPPSPLHKSSNEEQDNALIVRLVAPHFSVLLVGAAALSKYALNGMLSTIDHSFLQSDIVQIVGEAGKAFPTELGTVLQLARPSLLLISPAAPSAKLRKAGAATTITPPQFLTGSWLVVQTAQVGTIEVNSSVDGWSMKPA